MAETTSITITAIDDWTSVATDVAVALTLTSISPYPFEWFIGTSEPLTADKGHLVANTSLDDVLQTGSFVGTLYIRTPTPFNHSFVYTSE